MYRGSSAARIVSFVSLVCCGAGMTCPVLSLPVQPIPLDDVQFTRFEYQVLKFSNNSPESCEASVGAIQRAVITKTDEGLMLELWFIEQGDASVDACEADYSSDDQCRVIRAEAPRILTADEMTVVAIAVDGMQSREEAGDAPGGGSCNVPCFRQVYIRDDVMYETLNPCNDIYPAPHLSAASIFDLYQMFDFLLGVEIVPGNSSSPAMRKACRGTVIVHQVYDAGAYQPLAPIAINHSTGLNCSNDC